MPDKDVNIHVRARETEESKRKIEGVAQSTKEMGEKTEEAGRRSAAGMEKALATVAKYAATMVGVQKLLSEFTRALEENARAMDENAAAAEKHQKSLLRLQFLGGFFQERPELRQEVGALAEFGRRPYEEVANAWYNLRSKGAALSQGQQDSILREALEMGRTDPDLPLDTLVDMFALYAKKSGEPDANRIQNVLQETITQAGGSGADVAKYMPQFLPIGMAGGLTAAESAGLWSYATTLLGEASVATTGLKATFLGLEGKGSPEGQKLLKKLKITPEMDFFSKLDVLGRARAGGKFGLASAEQLVGREGASILLDMLKDPGAVRSTVGAVTAMDRGDIDLTRTRIEELVGSDEVARMEEDNRQLAVRIENLKAADRESLTWKNAELQREAAMREKGYAPYAISLVKRRDRHAKGLGFTPDQTGELPPDIGAGFSVGPYRRQLGGEDAGATIVNYNFDNSTHLRPVAGTRDDGRFSQD
jgi:hypothetical protein